jgi:hypothetical protein
MKAESASKWPGNLDFDLIMEKNYAKYNHLQHNGQTVFEILAALPKGKDPMAVMLKIRQLFPQISLTEVKEIYVMHATPYRDLYEYQGALFESLLDEEEFEKVLDSRNLTKDDSIGEESLTRMNRSELELVRLDGGGVPIYHYKGTPFTGTVVSYYDNGALFMEEEYEKGFQEGWIRYYHLNGRLDEEEKRHNNITIKGSFKEWDEDGNLLQSF